MSSTIRIAGVDYPDVPSVKFKDPQGNVIDFVIPAGTKNINQNGITDVSGYASADVAVPYLYQYDTLWQSKIADHDYSIPLLTGDLTGAWKVDISQIGFAPRITMLRPANNAASLIATASSATQYRLIWAIAFYDEQGNAQSGTRGGVAAVVYPDSSKCGGTSNANIGLYPVGTDLILACTTSNALSQNGVLKSANWQWRCIG